VSRCDIIEYQCAECRGRGFVEGIGGREVPCEDCGGRGDPRIPAFVGAHCWVEAVLPDRVIIFMRRHRAGDLP
jgi:hypothetical protein